MSSPTKEELLRKIDDAPLLMTMDAARKKLRKPRSVYADQILLMLAVMVLAIYIYGLRSLAVCICSVLCCAITDMIGCFLCKKEYSFKDLSNVAYGMAVALMLPACVEYYIVIIGAVLAITVKHIFGGKDNYIFNPAAVAIAFLIICYPQQVLMYPELGTELPIFGAIDIPHVSSIESSFIKNGALPNLSALDIFVGNFSGPMGTTHILVLLVCAVCLLFRKSISLAATFGGIGSMALISFLLTGSADIVVFRFISGFVLFGFIFLASDPQTLPVTGGGRLLYGISLGVIATIFRNSASIEGVFVFALLITNALSLYMDRLWFNIKTVTKQAFSYLKNNLGSFERMSMDAKQGKTPALSDTQEIIIQPVNYNMPPIDNKVTKVKRKKKIGFAEMKEGIADIFRKNKDNSQKTEVSHGDSKTDKAEENKTED